MPGQESSGGQPAESEPSGLAEVLRLAGQLAADGQPGEAEALLRGLLAQLAPVHFALGRMLLGKGELGPAIALLGVASLLQPESLDALLALASALARAGRPAEAANLVGLGRGM
ncbi:MAG: hypothetical protein HY744_26325 [Deltaproteobacteria bacterium]|nr:hypothetical protein [Deltaproteobacteria bacterium]